LFAPAAWPALSAATADLNWLLGRAYPRDSALRLVGDRYGLVARQRTAVSRCAASEADAAERRRRQVMPEAMRGRPLWLDAYNVLTTIEAALAGGIVLAARDGAFRDMASMHGSYRKVSETVPALRLLGETMAALGVAEAIWLLDRPVSNSGRLKGLIEDLAAQGGWPWEVRLVADPDPLLAETHEVVATADSVILDRCRAWLNLAREVIVGRLREARVVHLTGETC
jgi:hypothetical protein